MNIISQKIQSGAAIIDVRTPEEYREGAYPGARNIPLNVLPAKLAEVGPKDKPVVVYCASGGRSAAARGVLLSSGFTDVTNAGGLADMPE